MTEEAVASIYATAVANEDLTLFEGRMILTWGQETCEGSGWVRWAWSPSPWVIFSFSPDAEGPIDLPHEGVKLELVDRARSAPVVRTRVLHVGIPGQVTVEGVFTGEVLVDSPAPVEAVTFHVANFPPYLGEWVRRDHGASSTRLTARLDNYVVHLDDARFGDVMSGPWYGFAITHVGRITRTDGKPVRFEDLPRLQESLTWWLSLLRAERTAPILLVGCHENRRVWELWRSAVVQPWSGRRTWMPQFPVAGVDSLDECGRLLSAIAQLGEPTAAVYRALDWYTQSVSSSNPATTAVLAQAGLELLAWLRLVHGLGVGEGYERMPFADALRVALGFASIGRALPESFPAIDVAPRDKPAKPMDGPGLITEMRNAAVHPKPGRWDDDLRVAFEGGQLAIRYLELLMLHRLGYQGATVDRRGQSLAGDAVPWASSALSRPSD
jgi:hypothetical protein